MPAKIHPWQRKSRPTVGRISCLTELGARPIHAEPLQAGEQVSRRKNRDGREGGDGGRIAEHVESAEASEAGVALRERDEQGSR